MDYTKLYHDKEAFQRETLEARMRDYGFKNMSRMELFLWDLELFLQIQHLLKERVVLKGGAATQFYLPKEAQRTSVDIDLLFNGSEEEIEKTLKSIEAKLGDEDERLFRFRKHVPKNPKTNLPLYTYHTYVPSVLTGEERNARENDFQSQELKVEFITKPQKLEFALMTGEEIFAVNSKMSYQILPLNALFADKLTTLGSKTVGVQDDRLDEQVKQFYDILTLTKHCRNSMNASEIWNRYKAHAEEEWNDRAAEDGNWDMLKGKSFSLDTVLDDVGSQLERYELVDNGEDAELKKAINGFNGLYLNGKGNYSPAEVACGASLIRLVFGLLSSGGDWSIIDDVMKTEELLDFNDLFGLEKGQMVRQMREALVEKFGNVSVTPVKVLKAKNPRRIFWSVLRLENYEAVKTLIKDVRKKTE